VSAAVGGDFLCGCDELTAGHFRVKLIIPNSFLFSAQNLQPKIPPKQSGGVVGVTHHYQVLQLVG
jgi:hypothetical protein